jgi:hypothetical protein
LISLSSIAIITITIGRHLLRTKSTRTENKNHTKKNIRTHVYTRSGVASVVSLPFCTKIFYSQKEENPKEQVKNKTKIAVALIKSSVH